MAQQDRMVTAPVDVTPPTTVGASGLINTLIAAGIDADTQKLVIQNKSASVDMHLVWKATAPTTTAGAIKLAPGQAHEVALRNADLAKLYLFQDSGGTDVASVWQIDNRG